MEASNIEKFLFSIEFILSELVQVNVLVNKKTPLGDSFRRRNTPKKFCMLLKSIYERDTPLFMEFIKTQKQIKMIDILFLYLICFRSIFGVHLWSDFTSYHEKQELSKSFIKEFGCRKFTGFQTLIFLKPELFHMHFLSTSSNV